MPKLKKTQIDSSAIPRFFYRGRECFDWKHAAGVEIPFVYGEDSGTLLIVSTEKQEHEYRVFLRCPDGSVYDIRSTDLINGHIGACLGRRVMRPRYTVGQRITEERRDITITAVARRKIGTAPILYKMVAFRCNICGYERDFIREELIMQGSGCPVCAGKIVRRGFNDIPTTAPWMIPYFPGGEAQAATYTANSGRKLRFVCPHCAKLKEHAIPISSLNRTHSIGCPCGDRVSLPEKFLFRLFSTLDVTDYIRQVSAKDLPWCGRYRYDGMFCKNGTRYLLEIHGPQHYERTGFEKFAHTLEQVQENDRNKKALALANGILPEQYIILDCRKSTLTQIKNAILQSALPELLGFGEPDINWQELYEESLTPLARGILELAREAPDMPTKEIARRMGVCKSYPARVLIAHGEYGREEQNQRKNKRYFAEYRAQLLEQLDRLQAQEPTLSVTQLAQRVDRTPAAVSRMLRQYRPDTDWARLHENAERNRSQSTRNRVCKAVYATAPDGTLHHCSSLTELSRELEQHYGMPFPLASMSIAISKNRPYRGFRFVYADQPPAI